MKKFYHLNEKSLSAHKVKTYKELWGKLKKKGFKGISADVFTSIKKRGDDENRFRAVFSTAKEDRHGDIVEQNFDLKSFKKNPVLLDSHDYRSIESIVGKVEKIKVDKKLVGDIVFATDNPRGELARKLTIGGFLNTTSIGFIPKKFDDKGNIVESELLEISAVSVPANPQALIEKLNGNSKSKNIEDEENDEEDSEGDGNDGEDEWEEGDEKNKGLAGNKSFDVKVKEYENWDNGNDEIRLKVRDIAEFEDGTLKRVVFKETAPKIEAMAGNTRGSDKTAVQSFFFSKSESWAIDDAKKWFTQRQFEVLHQPKEPEKPKKVEPLDNEGKIPVEEEMSQSVEEKGKSKKQRLLSALKERELKRKKSLQKIYSAVKLVSENKITISDPKTKKDTNATINRAIRKLLTIKNQ